MTPTNLLSLIVAPGLDALARFAGVNGMDTPAARVMLIAIAGQESAWTARRQITGSAHGFWQFEPSGVRGVLEHPASAHYASRLLIGLGISPDDAYIALTYSDLLACGLARLLIWTDPAPLPTTAADGWACYARCWRPGRPRADDWGGNWAAAVHAVTGASQSVAQAQRNPVPVQQGPAASNAVSGAPAGSTEVVA